MATGQLQNFLKHLRKMLAHRRESGASDGLSLQAVPAVTIRGTMRWTNGKPAPQVWVTSIPDTLDGVLTNAEGKYELKAPKGVEGFAIMVGGRVEGGVIYIAHAVGKKPGGRQAIGDMHFERLDESIDGVDWEMREHERVKEER